MNLFGSLDVPEPVVSEERIARALDEIRRNARNRRLAMMAPLALVAAVLGAFVAAPHRYGGLALVPDADASGTQLPRVFGANGVWRLAEPIAEAPVVSAEPASVIEAAVPPPTPDYVLVPAPMGGNESLPVSASTPPTPTPGQSLQNVFSEEDFAEPVDAEPVDIEALPEDPAEIDWSRFRPVIVIDSGDASSTPEDSTAVEPQTPPKLSSLDEDVKAAATQPEEPAGEFAVSATAVTGDLSEANPSTPPVDPAAEETQPASRVATIIPRAVLVHSAHVSVTVRVVDDDSSVIDWCNTRVDWGDGSVAGVSGIDGEATCAALCEREASPSMLGIDSTLVFSHRYAKAIDAAPKIFVATGDGCDYTLAEFHLNPFAVVPY
jgi:hypothetical protein